MINEFEDKINENKKEMIENICKLIEIPSISEQNKAEVNMPFGKECNRALEYILKLGNKLGFRTKNVDGYCGYIEFGEGEELIGIIGHLDVVPADESDWKKTKPFEPKIIENKIYGRGAIDDKGPTISALYAMKVIKDTIKVNKRIRLIVGLNEEKSWKCIEYYKQHEEIPSMGFSPDADFPCIYAEKGIINAYIELPINKNKINLEKIDCKNNAINVVPKYCECELSINEIDKKQIEEYIEKIIEKTKFDVKIEKLDNNKIKIISKGISSHAAHPELGKNAITQLLIILAEVYEEYNIENELLEFFKKYLNTDYNGNRLKINSPDESGELTLNIGKIEIEQSLNTIKLGINIRVPIDTKIEVIKEKFLEKQLEYKELKISFDGVMEHLYISKESDLVKKLTNIFNEIANKKELPIAIGGATFARAFPNCVSFGANMPGEKDLCHQSDEYIDINNLIITTNIYAKAIYELGKLN